MSPLPIRPPPVGVYSRATNYFDADNVNRLFVGHLPLGRRMLATVVLIDVTDIAQQFRVPSGTDT
jgi:hypothetical protein